VSFEGLKSELDAAESRFKASGISDGERITRVNLLREQFGRAERERELLQREKGESDKTISFLYNLLDAKDKVILWATDDRILATKQRDRLREEVGHLHGEVEGLRQLMRNKDGEIARLTEDFSRAQTELQSAQQQLEALKAQTLQAISAAAKQITGTTRAACASGVKALYAMIVNCPIVAAETVIDVGGSVFHGATSRAELTLQELKGMCEQFQDRVKKDDSIFDELIRRASIFPYQPIVENMENDNALAVAFDVRKKTDGSFDTDAHGNFVQGMGRVIDGAIGKIYADFPGSENTIAANLRDYKSELLACAIDFARRRVTSDVQIFNFVGESMAEIRNAITSSANVDQIRTKIDSLSKGLQSKISDEEPKIEIEKVGAAESNVQAQKDAVFGEFIKRASIFPYQPIVVTEENNKVLADAVGVHENSDGSWSAESHKNFMDGLDRVINGTIGRIYATFSGSEAAIAGDLQNYKSVLLPRAITLASTGHRTMGIQIFNFVGNAMAMLSNAIATSSSIGEVHSKINSLTQALPAAPIS
jgi:hypothetical protein